MGSKMKRKNITVKTLKYGSIKIETVISWKLRWRKFVAPMVNDEQ